MIMAMLSPRINVLFVSQRNSLRSLLAQACLNHVGRERFAGFSCGTAVGPDVGPHPLVAPTLRAAGMAGENLTCKDCRRYTRVDGVPMRFVIALSEDAMSGPALVWPGQPDTALWAFPDLLDPSRPRAATAQDVMAMLHVMRRRIELLVSLPMRGVNPGDLRSDLRDLAYVR